MDKRQILSIVNQIAQIVIEKCETDEEVEQVKNGIEKCLEFVKSFPQT